MTWLKLREPQLTEFLDRDAVEWWLLYRDVSPNWWWRGLKPGFQHVQAIRREGPYWLRVDPHIEFTDIELVRSSLPPHQLVPGTTCQRVVALRRLQRLRVPTILAPATCVEQVKELLGIRAWWLVTPWQLFTYVRKREGVLR